MIVLDARIFSKKCSGMFKVLLDGYLPERHKSDPYDFDEQPSEGDDNQEQDEILAAVFA